jgi:hypothetical protein
MPPDEPDEVVDLGFAVMSRTGRHILLRTRGEEQVQQAREDFLSGEAELLTRRDKLRGGLIALLSEVDAIELVVQLSNYYAIIDPNTWVESHATERPSFLEYLILTVAGLESTHSKSNTPDRLAQVAGRAMNIVEEIFDIQSTLFIMDAIRASRDELDVARRAGAEFRLKSLLQSMGVRYTTYGSVRQSILYELFSDLDEETKARAGFTIEEAFKILFTCHARHQGYRESRVADSKRILKDLRKQLRRARTNPKSSPPEIQALINIDRAEADSHLRRRAQAEAFSNSRDACAVDSATLAREAEVDEASCASFLEAMSFDSDGWTSAHHSYPGPTNPFCATPFLRDPDRPGRYYLPIPAAVLEALQPTLEAALSLDPPTWERYLRHRGKYLERKSIEVLGTVLPGGFSDENIEWTAKNDSGEIDGLLMYGEATLIVQCKAGSVTAPTRRGAIPRMKSDLEKLVADAAEQHFRLQNALNNRGTSDLGLGSSFAPCLSPLRFDLIVTLEDLTPYVNETAKLARFGTLQPDRPYPWVVSLADLMLICHLLQGPELIHYICRRIKIGNIGNISAHDELDWVGHYISEGLYFDDIMTSQEIEYRLTSYTDPFDAYFFALEGGRAKHTPKPQRRYPTEVGRLLRLLQAKRSSGSLLASLFILDWDDEALNAANTQILAAKQRVAIQGEATVTVAFEKTHFMYVRRRGGAPTGRIRQMAQAKRVRDDLDMVIIVGEGDLNLVETAISPAGPEASALMRRLLVDAPVRTGMTTGMIEES